MVQLRLSIASGFILHEKRCPTTASVLDLHRFPSFPLVFMTNTQPDSKWFQDRAAEQIHGEQLRRAELFNGRAAMLGIVIGILTEAITGSGIAHQIGLGALVDGYAACRTQFLPFCF